MTEFAPLHAVMAGSGMGLALLTPRCRLMPRMFHAGYSSAAVSEVCGITEAALHSEMQPLLAAHLARRTGTGYCPTFLVADQAETQHVVAHAEAMGTALAECLQADWGTLAKFYAVLHHHRVASLFEDGFFLVGGRLLDVTLLDVLARDRTLMPPAPARPCPRNPNERYYLWMIEGERDQLGHYGQSETRVPWPGWTLLAFGRYSINGVPNAARSVLEAAVGENAAHVISPHTLAQQFKLQVYNRDAVSHWSQVAWTCTEGLVTLYYDHAASLQALYAALNASAYTQHGFGEFFCWYNHVAYSAAIDHLIAQAVIALPADCFTAALWQGTSLGTHFLS